MLTNQQLIHRQFIQSETWARIRRMALDHYGSICQSCGSHGTDVHHKTYKRFGGMERVEDLQVLCRQCHDAKHAALRSIRKSVDSPRRKRVMRVTPAYRYLSKNQKLHLVEKFHLKNDVELFVIYMSRKDIWQEIGRMLGVKIRR